MESTQSCKIKCEECQLDLAIDSFPSNCSNKERPARICRACRNRKRRLSRYGFKGGWEAFTDWIQSFGGKCCICDITVEPEGRSGCSATVDHCHSTGRIRGLLCRHCNSGVGSMSDDAAIARSAASYISKKKHNPVEPPPAKSERRTKVFAIDLEGGRQCTSCNQVLELTKENFHPNKSSSGGFNSVCKKCRHRKVRCRKYGTSWKAIEEMFQAAEGKCEICSRNVVLEHGKHGPMPDSASIDHCHASGRIRGILCSHCNLAVGLMRDSEELLTRAAEYLEKDFQPCT